MTTTSGNITITGTANSPLLTAVPQVFAAGVSIVQPIVTGTGNINITATSAANAPAFFNATVIGNGTITSTSGNITIQGINTNANTTATLAQGVQVLQAITTTSGKITFTAESNANADAFVLTSVTTPIASTGSITSASGNIEIIGLAKSTSGFGRGVNIQVPIATGSGDVSIMGEANGVESGTFLFGSITSTSGSFFLKGVNKNATTISASALVIDIRQNISTGSSGSITIEGESNGVNGGAGTIILSPSLATSNGNINIKGVSKNTNSTSFLAQGVGLFGCVINITGSGNLIIEGESNSVSQGVLASTVRMTTTTITTNTGSVFIKGKSKNTTANSVAVSIAGHVQSALGSITIEGESSSPTTVVGILATLSTTIGNIFIKGKTNNTTSVNGLGVIIVAPISSTQGNITVEGEINAGMSAISLPSFGSGSIISTSGNIFLKGIAKGTARKGVAIEQNVTSSAGKITIIGETEGQGDAIHIEFNGSVVSAGGDILLDGKCKNTIAGAGVRANGAINAGTGKITIIGECDAGNTILQQAQGIFIAATAPLTTNGGDILLNGISRGTTGLLAMGVQLDAVVNAGTGKITIIGENNADNIEGLELRIL